jgi:hypothetical protein
MPFERPNSTSGINICIMAPKETVSEREDWIQCKGKVRTRWLTLVHMIMNLRLPMKYGKFLTCSGTIGFSRRTRLLGVKSVQVPNC